MSSSRPWADLISEDRVIVLHAYGIERWGGEPTDAPRPGCLDASIGSAWTAESYLTRAGDSDARPGLNFAGHLLHYLTKNHCFIDGNKRIGWLVATEVLARHHLTVEATTEEAFALCDGIVSGEVPDGRAVTQWLASRLVAQDRATIWDDEHM